MGAVMQQNGQTAAEGLHVDIARHLPSQLSAISPFVDAVMLLIRNNRCVPGGETDVEIAMREALANAIVHGNHEDPGKQVHVMCRCWDNEVLVTVRDEGQGFNAEDVTDPTAPGKILSEHGRGIYLMKALMDEVRFEAGGTVVQMRKRRGNRHSS
jgi:serine/threonine-protein kinase RsbW